MQKKKKEIIIKSKMKFIVFVGSLLFTAVFSQTEQTIATTTLETTTSAETKKEGPREGFNPQNWKPRENSDGSEVASDKKWPGPKGPRGPQRPPRQQGQQRPQNGPTGEGFGGFRGKFPGGQVKGPQGGFKWAKKPTSEGETAATEVVVTQTTSV